MKMSKGAIGYISTLFSGLLSIPVFLSEHGIALSTLFFVGISAVFGCIHYYKSWRLKDVERTLKIEELKAKYEKYRDKDD